MPKAALATTTTTHEARAKVLADLPVTEHRMRLGGFDTAVLVGGTGDPVVLLPGPGESSLWWARILARLTESHRVIAPDLPGTGSTGHGTIDAEHVLGWLDALIERTCDAPPVLVGHVVGGALAARFAIRGTRPVAGLVLVDTLGLRRFLPSPRFGFRLMRFLSKPSEERFEPFLDQCMFDAAGVRQGFGPTWDAFLEYYLDGVRDEQRKGAMGDLIKQFGAKRIPARDLAAIDVPTTLIWGRHDKATPVKVARAASRRYGWPLHVIERSGDDPKLERPDAFMDALGAALK